MLSKEAIKEIIKKAKLTEEEIRTALKSIYISDQPKRLAPKQGGAPPSQVTVAFLISDAVSRFQINKILKAIEDK